MTPAAEQSVIAPAFADKCPPTEPMVRILASAISEMNTTPGTLTDLQQARALQRILARRGLRIYQSPSDPVAASSGRTYGALAGRAGTSATPPIARREPGD